MAFFFKSQPTAGVSWVANTYWFLLSVCVLVLFSWLGWQGMRYQQFHFDFLYDAMAIADHIAQYGPQNRHFLGFEQLTKIQHVELFNGIVSAIHQQGHGLTELTFSSSYGVQPLLTQAEVVHLTDVALLITGFNQVAFYCAVLSVLLLSAPLLWVKSGPLVTRLPVFNPFGLLCLYAGVGFSILLGVVFVGPKAVFYWLHEVVFPAQHQWFFYYQDSLMTTLMKAPDLFGMITLGLLGYIAVITLVCTYGIRSLLAKVKHSYCP